MSIDANEGWATAPSISVVIVSDYAAGQHGGWVDIRKSLKALALQDLRLALVCSKCPVCWQPSGKQNSVRRVLDELCRGPLAILRTKSLVLAISEQESETRVRSKRASTWQR